MRGDHRRRACSESEVFALVWRMTGVMEFIKGTVKVKPSETDLRVG